MLLHIETKSAETRTSHDPATALIRELIAMTDGAAELLFHEGHDWASATFTGMRHRLALMFHGADGVSIGNFLAERLEDHEFTLRHHVVIDIHIAHRVERHEGEPTLLLEIEALTVEDG